MQSKEETVKNLINCGTCGYPLTPEERTTLVEKDGVMVKPAPVQEPVWCNHCNGSGRMVRDPDIGTDQECFVCDGAGVPAAPTQDHQINQLEKFKNHVLTNADALGVVLDAPAAPVQEPVAWIQPDHLQKAQKAPFLCRVEPHKRDDFVPLYTTTPSAQPALVPLTEWVSVDDRLPESGGYYLVTVDTDDGPHVDVLIYNDKRKHWEHEGEPTFCHSYFFSPTHWAVRPEAAHGIKETTE
jgi:hypothetical protein